MAGLKRKVGAGRVVGVAGAPTRPSPARRLSIADAILAWRILGEDGRARALGAAPPPIPSTPTAGTHAASAEVSRPPENASVPKEAKPASALNRPPAPGVRRHPSLADLKPPASAPETGGSLPDPLNGLGAPLAASTPAAHRSVVSIGPSARARRASSASVSPREPGREPDATLARRVHEAVVALLDAASQGRFSGGQPARH